MTAINRRMACSAAIEPRGHGRVRGLAAAAEIRVLNWQGYGTDEACAVEAFEKKTGNKVVHDYFTSEQEMLTKLRTNPGAYDVVLINSAFTGQAKAEGLIGQDRHVRHAERQGPGARTWAQNADLAPGGEVYGVAWTWGVTSLAVNKDEVKPRRPRSPCCGTRNMLEGSSIRDDGVEAVQFAALATGPEHQRHQGSRGGEGQAEGADAAGQDLLGVGERLEPVLLGGRLRRSRPSGAAARADPPPRACRCSSSCPQEGAIGWLDGLSIPATSKNQDAARAFINWMIDPEFYVEWAAKGAPSSANAKAAAALPDTDFNKQVLGDPAVVARVQFMKPLSDETRKAYLGALAGHEDRAIGPRAGGVDAAASPTRLRAGTLLAPAYLWLTVAVFLPLSAMLFFSFLSAAPFTDADWHVTRGKLRRVLRAHASIPICLAARCC